MSEVDYAEIEKALRKNGIAILKKGNRDKLSMGRDGKTLVIYGNAIYSESRDQNYQSDSEWINRVVAQVKRRCQELPAMKPGQLSKLKKQKPKKRTK